MNANNLLQNPRQLVFIGGGNMAEAIFGGLIERGYPSDHIVVSEPMQERLDYLRAKFPKIRLTTDNSGAVTGEACSCSPADVAILSVKPQVLSAVVASLKIPQKTLVFSIAAGIRASDIARWFACDVAIVRCMPNTPALVGEGAAGLFATKNVTKEQKQLSEDIMSTVSPVVCWVENEDHIDSVTGISGSGPAYFFLFMEAMERAGIEMGLSQDMARRLSAQTCLGAAKMVLNSPDSITTLRRKVTSPNGTTEAAIKTMERLNLPNIVVEAVKAAEHRGRELSDEFGSVEVKKNQL
ncbi:uncharacterized protein VTP21DRAFT_10978 [Calcarisporiella thermophila]|uniref:uncharacterized protein n=1 Tax=Calcarisporiella thermophila TaxID=911321 RepID=UPI0037420354